MSNLDNPLYFSDGIDPVIRSSAGPCPGAGRELMYVMVDSESWLRVRQFAGCDL